MFLPGDCHLKNDQVSSQDTYVYESAKRSDCVDQREHDLSSLSDRALGQAGWLRLNGGRQIIRLQSREGGGGTSM
jgi:hypothetical protein